MCQQYEKNFAITSARLLNDLPLRNYRRQMKPILARKVTASARINLNKFWNDLEEFYNRYDDRRTSNNNNPLIDLKSVYDSMPAYTTDTYDHDREAAENDLNEKMEAEKFESSTYISYSDNLDMKTSSCDEDDSGSEEWDCCPSSYVSYSSQSSRSCCWNDFGFNRPPRTLVELINRISTKH